ncbi:hypothetical protein [Burkholderia alba]|uniref:hypothetical protein n=1 Tax=Burkholderia alba TaxID=2683677 RepID=UPI002B0591BB|nr:hypothetical protein [Burkholderia alba]
MQASNGGGTNQDRIVPCEVAFKFKKGCFVFEKSEDIIRKGRGNQPPPCVQIGQQSHPVQNPHTIFVKLGRLDGLNKRQGRCAGRDLNLKGRLAGLGESQILRSTVS